MTTSDTNQQLEGAKHTQPFSRDGLRTLLGFGRKNTGAWQDAEDIEAGTAILPDEDHAALLSASPELLAACERLLAVMGMQEQREAEELHITQEVAMCIWNKAKVQAKDAIFKATGESK